MNFLLHPYQPSPVDPSNLVIGRAEQVAPDFPTRLAASRIPFTFDLDGTTVDGGQLYLPPDASGPLSTLFIVYPSALLN